MKPNISVSIIIPTYNTASYISKCIESVLDQTLESIEILLIDNGSTDGTYEICQEYATGHANIKCMQILGGRQGRCRNIGIQQSKGEFIGFVDSDDWCTSDMYEKLYVSALKYDADIVICKVSRFDNNETFLNDYYKDYYFTDGLYSKSAHPYLTRLTGSWNKIYKRELLMKNNIKFTEGITHQDVPFTYLALFYASRISGTIDSLYNYRAHTESSTAELGNGTKKIKTINDIFLMLNELESIIKNENMPFVWWNAFNRTIEHHFNFLITRFHPTVIPEYLTKIKNTIGYIPTSTALKLEQNIINSLEPNLKDEILTAIHFKNTHITPELKKEIKFYKKRSKKLRLRCIIIVMTTITTAFILGVIAFLSITSN